MAKAVALAQGSARSFLPVDLSDLFSLLWGNWPFPSHTLLLPLFFLVSFLFWQSISFIEEIFNKTTCLQLHPFLLLPQFLQMPGLLETKPNSWAVSHLSVWVTKENLPDYFLLRRQLGSEQAASPRERFLLKTVHKYPSSSQAPAG